MNRTHKAWRRMRWLVVALGFSLIGASCLTKIGFEELPCDENDHCGGGKVLCVQEHDLKACCHEENPVCCNQKDKCVSAINNCLRDTDCRNDKFDDDDLVCLQSVGVCCQRNARECCVKGSTICYPGDGGPPGPNDSGPPGPGPGPDEPPPPWPDDPGPGPQPDDPFPTPD